MTLTCDYCHSVLEEGATKCANCGAALSEREAPDFRFCPHCKRRLLALGSPACNYCGRALPEDFAKARESLWRKVSDVGKASPEELEELEKGSDDAMRRALKSLLDLDERTRRK
ncbi:MAG: Double zinc ribbon [Acidobacteriota bacterium]|jgi:predicted amidophosphoribosyltransferase|nr:Double zinc ribbon [Acidobacteriota bacterium]